MKKETVELLNTYLADSALLFIKWHNLHWNVIGNQFKNVHEYLEGLYDDLADVVDEVAEIIKMHDEMPLASMKDYLKVATVSELESKEISINDALDVVIGDMKSLKKSAEKIRILSNDEDLYDVVGMLEDHLAEYNKNLWFLKATRK